MISLEAYLDTMLPASRGYVARKASPHRPFVSEVDLTQDIAETLIEVWTKYAVAVSDLQLYKIGNRAVRKKVASRWRMALATDVRGGVEAEGVEDVAGLAQLEMQLLFTRLMDALRDAPRTLLTALFARAASAPSRSAYGLSPRRRTILEIVRETGLQEPEVTKWIDRVYALCRNQVEELT